MKNITTKVTLFIAAAALCITINACKKSATDSDITTAQDEAQASAESNYIENAGDAGAAQSTGSQPRSNGGGVTLPSCATITFNADTAAGLKIMTITFPSSPVCTSPDGKVRSGQIIVTWTGRYRDSGTVIHTYTNNYYVDGNAHNYIKWVKNVGRVGGFYTFAVTDTASIVTPTGTISWVSAKTRTWTSGYNNPWWLYWLTTYSITGTEQGVDRKGLSFSATITSPITIAFDCIYGITGGTFDLQVQGKAERIISFVDGCSGNATCTIDGVTYDFRFVNY